MRFDKIFKDYKVDKVARKYIWLQPMRSGEKFGKIQYLDKSDELFDADKFVVGAELTLFCTTRNKGTSSFPKYFCMLDNLDAYKSEILDNFLYVDDYSEEAYKELERFEWDEETLSKIESHKKTSLELLTTTVKFETKEELEDAVEYRLTFGKYKNCLVRLIPLDYINWLYKQVLENKVDNEEVIEAVTARVKLEELNAKCESEEEIEETLTEEKKIEMIKKTCIKEQIAFCEYNQANSIMKRAQEKEGYDLVHTDFEFSNPFEFEDSNDTTFLNHVVVYAYYKKL